MSDPVRFCYEFDPLCPEPPFDPDDGSTDAFFAQADEPLTVARLREGNDKFAAFRAACADAAHAPPGPKKKGKTAPKAEPFVVRLDRLELGLDPVDGFPTQRPFAAVLGCADARVPAEILFGQTFNDLFVVRTAGNTLGGEGAGTGSIVYALQHFVNDGHATGHGQKARLRLVVALGHRNCGAVVAALKEYQKDVTGGSLPGGPIGALLRPIFFPVVQVAADAFEQVNGPKSAEAPQFLTELTEVTVYLNAAWSGHELREWAVRQGSAVFSKVRVRYGVFDVSDFRVRSEPPAGYRYERERKGDDPFLAAPPGSLDGLHELGVRIARNLRDTTKGKGVSRETVPLFFGTP